MHLIWRTFKSAVFWSYLTTLLRFGGILLVLPVVLRSISTEQLGLYYAFQSLVVITILLDLGMSPSISRSVSFALAGASELEGTDRSSRDRAGPNWHLLAQLFGTFQAFYRCAGLSLFLILSTLGSVYIWGITSNMENPNEARLIWLFLCFGMSWNFSHAIWPVMLAGMNRVREQQFSQLVSILSGYLVTTFGLLFGFGLWALALSSFFQALILRELARQYCRQSWKDQNDFKLAGFDRSLFVRLWPSSWRTGIIGVTYSLYLSAPVFFVSLFGNLDEVAQIGLAMQLALIIAQVSTVPIQVKLPLFSMLKISGSHQQVRLLFTKRSAFYVALFLLGAGGVIFSGNWALKTIFQSKTHLPTLFTTICVFSFVGLEGFQAIFRNLCIASNSMSFWPFFLIGGLLSAGLSAALMQFGFLAFFISFIVLKFFLVDIAVYRAGVSCLRVPKH